MVYIIGAGPGDPELITVKGQRLLKEADVIIYAGSLVNPALLDYAKADCEIYNSASMTLGEVIETITAAEQEGKMTVRLHTGDPAICRLDVYLLCWCVVTHQHSGDPAIVPHLKPL